MTAFNFPCDWKSGFVMDPTQKKRMGYLMDFDGLGIKTKDPFKKENCITAFTQFQGTTSCKLVTLKDPDKTVTGRNVQCVGVLENFSWGGGVGDAICFSVYVPSQTAQALKGMQAQTLTTTKITSLSWWIAKYDEETKQWYEECFPLTSAPTDTKCQLNAHGSTDTRLHVADIATKISSTIDVNVYQVYFEIVPSADVMWDIQIATSPSTKVALHYGVKIGTQAAGTGS
jgi:hypothetical protein